MSESFVKHHGIVTEPCSPFEVQVATGVTVSCNRIVRKGKLSFGKSLQQRVNLHVLPIGVNDVDIFLSVEWARSWHAIINLDQDTVTIQRSKTPKSPVQSVNSLQTTILHTAGNKARLNAMSMQSGTQKSELLSPKQFSKHLKRHPEHLYGVNIVYTPFDNPHQILCPTCLPSGSSLELPLGRHF